MNFLDVALRLAALGFRCFPLIPKTKRPLPLTEGDHFDAATVDPEQIKTWAEQVPNANVGLSPDEHFCFLETDDEAELLEKCGDRPADIWDTMRVSARENRCYYVFRQTMRTRKAGNMTVTREGKDNLFEFKQHRLYVVGPGSIHPKTGKPYGVEWRTIPAMPDVLLNRLCELYGAPDVSASARMSEAVQSETDKLDRFLEHYEVAPLGDWFNKGKQWYRSIICPWEAQHENPNQGTSTCIVYTEGGGYGFDCKHRCASKSWREFRAAVQERLPDRKFSFTDVTVQIGGSIAPAKFPAVEIPDHEPMPKRSRPIYPCEVWRETAAGEFAKLCTRDNNIPEKLYLEAFRCCLGAVVGDRISCPVEGALPRSYTVIVAPKGRGKGTAIRRCVTFFRHAWGSSFTSVTPGLLFGGCESMWKPKGVGAWMSAASSAPGMARLCKEAKSTPTQMRWASTLPRILSVHEEMKTFLSALFIEGGVGSDLEGVVCSLWDDTSFNTKATAQRDAIYGEMMFSLLAGVTEEDWFDILSRGNAIGGGLMSRFNIIGTEGKFDLVSDMKPIDFAALRAALFPRIVALEDAPARIEVTDEAKQLVRKWTSNLPEGSERMNVQVWRSALLLAWLRHEDSIGAKTAEDAIRLGDYQVASHEYYATKVLDNALARTQEKILRGLRMMGLATRRTLFKKTHGERDGTELWNRAFDGLLKGQQIGEQKQDGRFYVVKDE